ncbi:MAG TPA: Uma2 family endonuclease [Actinomycetota bacterium]
MAARPGNKLTYQDYASFPDDGLRREIVDGEVMVTPSANTRHQELVGRVFVALFNHGRSHGGGRVFVAPYDVLLGTHDIVQPDVVFVGSDRASIVTGANIKGSPTRGPRRGL